MRYTILINLISFVSLKSTMATSMNHLNGKRDHTSKKIVKLEGLDNFKFGFSDANDPNENVQVDTLVRVGSQIKEISIWAQRVVSELRIF